MDITQNQSSILGSFLNEDAASPSPTASGTASSLLNTIAAINMSDNPKIEDFELVGPPIQLTLTVVYGLTAIVALLGNSISILVLLRGKRSSRELRLLLVNLSLSDILMSLFSIPSTYTQFILGRWIFGPTTCPVVLSIQLLSVFVSIYTLTIIGVDRYIAITRPFFITYWSRSYAPVIVIIIWLIGLGLSSEILFTSRAEPFITIDGATYYYCQEFWPNVQTEQFYTVALFIAVFAFPLIVLSFVYGSISLTLWRHSAPGNAHPSRDGAANSAKIKVIKMLMTIVILFALCWAPLHIFQLIRVFRHDWLMSFSEGNAGSPLYLGVVICSHWLAMANSCVNPIIYCFMSDNFRIDLKNIAKKLLNTRRIYNSCCLSRLNSSLSSSTQSMPGGGGGGGGGLGAGMMIYSPNGDAGAAVAEAAVAALNNSSNNSNSNNTNNNNNNNHNNGSIYHNPHHYHHHQHHHHRHHHHRDGRHQQNSRKNNFELTSCVCGDANTDGSLLIVDGNGRNTMTTTVTSIATATPIPGVKGARRTSRPRICLADIGLVGGLEIHENRALPDGELNDHDKDCGVHRFTSPRYSRGSRTGFADYESSTQRHSTTLETVELQNFAHNSSKFC